MGKKAVKRSGGAKKKAAKKKATKGPVNRKEVREQIAGLVANSTEKMANAMIEEAGKGLLPQYKFLLEVSGIYPASAAEEGAAEDSNDLAKVLLDRLQFPNEPENEKEEDRAAGVAEETVSVE